MRFLIILVLIVCACGRVNMPIDVNPVGMGENIVFIDVKNNTPIDYDFRVGVVFDSGAAYNVWSNCKHLSGFNNCQINIYAKGEFVEIIGYKIYE